MQTEFFEKSLFSGGCTDSFPPVSGTASGVSLAAGPRPPNLAPQLPNDSSLALSITLPSQSSSNTAACALRSCSSTFFGSVMVSPKGCSRIPVRNRSPEGVNSWRMLIRHDHFGADERRHSKTQRVHVPPERGTVICVYARLIG